MPQVYEFALPDLGEGLTEATVVNWLVEVGDVVDTDQPVVEVETAKALVEVPCPYAGVVTARFGDQGAEVPVGSPLITVAVGPAVGPAAPGAEATAGTPGADGVGPEPETSGNVLVGYGTGAPAARRRRVRSGAGAGQVTASAAATAAVRPSAPPVAAPSATVRAADGPVAVISPLVRRVAREHGLDLRALSGSGHDGLILRADVERAVRDLPGATPPPAVVPEAGTTPEPGTGTGTGADSATVPSHGVTRTPLRGFRGVVADKLSRSRREIPDATCWVDADATELMAARAAMNTPGLPKLSVLALLARICTAALARYPELNAAVDTEAREVLQFDAVHLGFAAQTPRGLVVPVVRDAQERDADALSAEFARLTGAARAGTLTPGDLTGGTFTLNNYGVFGVDGSTPIINHPEAAMLGVGRIVPKPWVHEGELAIRQVVQLSLTFDHRVCDGGTAGGFLRYVADRVERPALLLRSL